MIEKNHHPSHQDDKKTIILVFKGNPALRESLFEKVKQDNKREFNKWKRELDGTMPRNYKGKKITLDSFLWDKLNNGSEITDFNKTTRDYILTFPHIIVKDFRPRTEQTQETIN